MKSFLKVIGVFTFSMIMFNVSAQSTNPGWPVSKGVQHYSNKNLASFNSRKVRMQGVPSFVQSKGVHASQAESLAGNVRMTGYPNWLISKPVNLINR